MKEGKIATGKERVEMLKARHTLSGEVSSDGKWTRQRNRFTTPFGDGNGELPVESDRYRLIWSQACPWAHRSAIVIRLLGLEKVISIGTVDPIRPNKPESDWAFSLDPDDEDPVLHVKYLSDLYRRTDPEYRGRSTVPAVVDVTTGLIVNNDYFNLTRYWETAWRRYHKDNAPELYPTELRGDIDRLNDIIFDEVNNGVYKVNNATTQEQYDQAYNSLFNRLKYFDDRLEDQRFLFGDYVTESDVRLYVTLARFDSAYFNGFRANYKMIRDYRNLWGYARDLYSQQGFGETTNFEAIRAHYHTCLIMTNPYNIVPLGPDNEDWKKAHGRERLSSDPDNAFLAEK